MVDELLDIVDNQDNLISQESRSVVHQKGLLHRGVHVFLVAPDGRLLVQQRSRQVRPAQLCLIQAGIAHRVLNALQNADEAALVASAGGLAMTVPVSPERSSLMIPAMSAAEIKKPLE